MSLNESTFPRTTEQRRHTFWYHRSSNRRSIQAIPILVAMVAPLLAFGSPAAADPAPAPRIERIEVDPGVQLDAGVYKSSEPGQSPLIIIPPGYGAPNLLNIVTGAKLAAAGYDVIAYTPRGQWFSGRQNNLISEADIDDVSKIIDWAGTNLGSDTQRVGMTGISQGSVLSLMAAANDHRVRAVAAMSTSFRTETPLIVNNTWFSQFMTLVKGAQVVNPLGPDLVAIVRGKYDTGDRSELTEAFDSRAASTKLDALNSNDPAILIANGWQDAAFPPAGVTNFFDQLTTPKRLMLMPGDHMIPELGGLSGQPNESWDATYRWFDHYLKGSDNGANLQPPVHLEPVFGGAVAEFDSWQASIAPMERRYLGPTTNAADSIGDLSSAPTDSWSTSIVGGIDPAADSGPLILAGAGAPYDVRMPGLLNAVDRTKASVWSTTPMTQTRMISGAPQLTVPVTPSDADFTVVSYLYDVDEMGAATLLGHAPYTGTNLSPGATTDVRLSLQPLRYTVPVGHRLSLVIDTDDERYRSETATSERLTFGSTPTRPAILDIPWDQR